MKDNVAYTHRPDLSAQKQNDYESLWIEIHNSKGRNTICGAFYRHPHGNVDAFLNHINMIVESVHRENKFCVLLGDFNLDLLKFESHPDTDRFLNILGTFYFHPQILQPTRITDHSATLIDNIFFNSLEHFVISGNLCYDLTDHLPNFLIVSKLSSLPTSTKVYGRDYSNLDKQALITDIQSIDWEEVLNNDYDPSCMFDNFYNKLSEVIDQHVPVKQLSKQNLKARSKPWITSGIRTSIQIKNGLFKKFLKTKSIYYHAKFKIYRNKLNHLIKLAKRNYYNNFFAVHVKDGKRIWHGIKQIIQIKTQVNQKVNKIVIDNREIVDPKPIANALNDFFANIGTNLACSIPSSSQSAREFMSSRILDSLFLSPVTENEIEEEIAKLNVSKAVGPSSIPIFILKILKCELSGPLQTIFNTSFLGIVPEKFKMARVIPVFKKDSQTTLNNYRPISFFYMFNKLLEKLMYKRIVDFLDKRQLIYSKQFGFRSHYSTEHAVLSIIDQVQLAIEDHDYSCGIFLDFSKAFDTVNLQILLTKRDYFGIRGVVKDWFTSYLRKRTQFVSLGAVTSDIQPVSCGVPQGSVLGPLLFLIYVNDFHNCSKLLDFHLFADDANLFLQHRYINMLESLINSELEKVHTWLCANRLSLNIDKSNFVIFRPIQRKLPKQVILSINNQMLTQETSIRYLGVYIDYNANWKTRITYISKKVKRSIGILSKLLNFISTKILLSLYYALVEPFLNYCIIAWDGAYRTTLQPLFILQKKALRIITFTSFNEHSSPLFKDLRVVKLFDIIALQLAVFMYKFHNKLLPPVFDHYFNPVRNVHSYNTRLSSKMTYAIPKARTNYGIFNIRFQGAKVWNDISDDLKLLPLKHFKKNLKLTFFENY